MVAVALLGFFLGVMGCFLCTPLLWKLEEPTGLELAGHSAPADWLLVAAGLVGAAGTIAIHTLVMRRKPSAPG